METNASFIAKVIIEVMNQDPVKIIDAQDDAKMMIQAGADFGTSRADLMAEYALTMFKAQNPITFPELKTWTEADDDRVIDLVSAYITKAGW